MIITWRSAFSSKLSEDQILGSKPEADIPENLRTYIAEFMPVFRNQLKSERSIVPTKVKPTRTHNVINFVQTRKLLLRTMIH